jgi:predicted alpha/beta superfamily hydrolase
MKLAVILATITMASASLAAAAPTPTPTLMSQGPAVQMGAERFVLHAQHINRDFLIEVTAPLVPPLPGQKLPVIYALDGGYGLVGQSARVLGGSGAMAPALVVSVGYLPNTSDAEHYRNTDLMHLRAMQGDKMDGGGGAAFEAFLDDELRPLIDARYPTDPKRAVLFGHSLGGLFAASVLAHRPDDYWAYLIASPSVWAAPDLPDRLRAVASAGGGRRVFIGAGGLERADMTGGAAKLATALSGPGSKFQVRSQVFEGQGHMPSYLLLASTALPYLLPPPPAPTPVMRTEIRLEPEVLDRYVGVYRLDAGRIITVTRQGGQLVGQLTGLPPVQMFADAPTTFFSKIADAQVRFVLGSNGRARSLVLRLNGAESTAALEP